MTRLTGRWADDLTAPADPVIDPELAKLHAEATRFRRALLAWLAVVILVALAWHLVGPVISISEAAGAWIGLAVLFVVIVAVLAGASRRSRR